jgi:hypothetical protein
MAIAEKYSAIFEKGEDASRHVFVTWDLGPVNPEAEGLETRDAKCHVGTLPVAAL